MKLLITWNIILTLVVGLLLWNMFHQDEHKRTYDIAQDTVLCGYIDDLRLSGRIDTTNKSCQRDVELIFDTIRD